MKVIIFIYITLLKFPVWQLAYWRVFTIAQTVLAVYLWTAHQIHVHVVTTVRGNEMLQKWLQLSLCKTKSTGENTAFICSLSSEWFLSVTHIIEGWDHLYFMVVLEQQHFPKPALTLRLSDTLGASPCATSWAPQHLDPHSRTWVQTFTLH